MRAHRLLINVMILFLLSAGAVQAAEFSSRIGTGLLISGLADNMSGRGESTIYSLNDRPATVTRAIPLVLFDLRYAKEKNTFFFAYPAGSSDVNSCTELTLTALHHHDYLDLYCVHT